MGSKNEIWKREKSKTLAMRHLALGLLLRAGPAPTMRIAPLFSAAFWLRREGLPRKETIYGSLGEKSVRRRKVESTFSTSFPLASDVSRTRRHSGSSPKAFQLTAAASRLGCARM